VRLDTIRDTVSVPKYVHIVRYDTIHDTADGKPIHLPIPISRYLFTDDSTYRMEVEGYNVQANSIEVYPRTVTQTIIQRVEVPGRPKRWGIGVSAGAALTPQGIRPYLGVGVQYNLVVF
jgi:opacity protein-like surface antigen